MKSSSGRPELRDVAAAPNLISLARIALVPVALVVLASGHRFWAAGVLVVLFATDGLDGLIARRLGRVTELGKILDPAADKLAVGVVLLYLVAVGEFPLWVFLLVVLRDVGLIMGGVTVSRRTGTVPAALPVGKIALAALAVVTIVFAADLAVIEPACVVLAVAAVVVSGVGYALAGRRLLARGRAGGA